MGLFSGIPEVTTMGAGQKKQAASKEGFRVPTEPPPFTKGDLKAAIPAHCFERSNLKSFAYLAADCVGVSVLAYLATCISFFPVYLRYVLWPAYWVLQGGVCTGLWVVAHECGHRAFSPSTTICDVVGLIFHSVLLVPYHSWRISHAKHHRSTCDIERDEVFLPKKRSTNQEEADKQPNSIVVALQTVGMFVLGWYVYLSTHSTGRDYGRTTNHYDPRSPLFNDRQFWAVVISDIGVAFVLSLAALSVYVWDLSTVMCYYGVPLMVVNFWLLLYTYLHHTDPALPHYAADSWSWLQGALATVDRDYGIFWNTLHHDIGNTHVLHHLFSTIPHYHAKEATEAIKPILGPYYYESKQGILSALWKTSRDCRFVDDVTPGGVLWFHRPQGTKSS